MGKMAHAAWSNRLRYNIIQVINKNTGFLQALNTHS